MKWIFIVFCVYLLSLCFRQEQLPASWANAIIDAYAPTNLIVRVSSMSVGFRHGLYIRGLKVYDCNREDNIGQLLSADSISIFHLQRRVEIDALRLTRLDDEYYKPGNHERNERIEVELPKISEFELILNDPHILGLTPRMVSATVSSSERYLGVDGLKIYWGEGAELSLAGHCSVDFETQRVEGEVAGRSMQSLIRPLIVALDVPVALPYLDGFTEIPESVDARCAWRVNLMNNDFDLDLGIDAKMGKYNSVTMQHAKGDIHLHVYTRGDSLNYRHVIGPISAVSPRNRPLDGTITVEGTNDFNRVTVFAKSGMPLSDLLKIGGFTGDYVGDDVGGDTKCDLEFRFPRSMTDNYEVLNGRGSVEIKNGHILRLKGFRGLLELLAEKVPGVSWFTDSTQASADYVIEDGVLKSDNIYIEGAAFSIKMYGEFDIVSNSLNFTARVQFGKNDSIVGKIVHPLTWPVTKLLLEFRLIGTTENPQWSYLSVIDRIVGD